MTRTDPGLDAVRRVRETISRECGNDAARLIAHYLKLQTEFGGNVIRGPEEDGAERLAAADRASRGR